VNNIPAISGGVWPTGNGNSLLNGQNGHSVLTSRTPSTYTAATSYMASSIN